MRLIRRRWLAAVVVAPVLLATALEASAWLLHVRGSAELVASRTVRDVAMVLAEAEQVLDAVSDQEALAGRLPATGTAVAALRSRVVVANVAIHAADGSYVGGTYPALQPVYGTFPPPLVPEDGSRMRRIGDTLLLVRRITGPARAPAGAVVAELQQGAWAAILNPEYWDRGTEVAVHDVELGLIDRVGSTHALARLQLASAAAPTVEVQVSRSVLSVPVTDWLAGVARITLVAVLSTLLAIWYRRAVKARAFVSDENAIFSNEFFSTHVDPVAVQKLAAEVGPSRLYVAYAPLMERIRSGLLEIDGQIAAGNTDAAFNSAQAFAVLVSPYGMIKLDIALENVMEALAQRNEEEIARSIESLRILVSVMGAKFAGWTRQVTDDPVS